MKRKIMIITFSLLFSLSIIWGDATGAVTSLVGKNAEGYLGPIGTILGTNMNSGFYRKASPHKILGFDFTFDIVYAMAPAGQTTYNFYKIIQIPRNFLHNTATFSLKSDSPLSKIDLIFSIEDSTKRFVLNDKQINIRIPDKKISSENSILLVGFIKK